MNNGLPASFPPCVVAPQSNASACSIVAPSLTKTALDNQSSPLLKTGSKVNSPETEMMPQMVELNTYIDKNLSDLKEQIAKLPAEQPKGWEELNELFIKTVKGQEKCKTYRHKR